ncbi:MAG: autotransporter outer membrane beta-barrel domain-containing protein, partial [Burkholderiaceae bacterium]
AKDPLSLWMGGSVDFGQHYVNGRQTGFKFSTSGISLGADYRLNDLASVGLGAGFARDSSEVGSHGSATSGQSVVAALYGTLRPHKGMFVDGLVGYGALSFDSTRYITDGGGFATGSRSGTQAFGSIAAGVEYRRDGWLLSPYARLDLVSATLGAYTETAAGRQALSYDQQTLRSTSGTLGVRAEGQYSTPTGIWMPRARVEFRRQLDGGDDAGVAYADLAGSGAAYTVRTASLGSGNWGAGLGMKLQLRNGLAFTVEYNSNLDLSNGRSQSVMLGVAIPFE